MLQELAPERPKVRTNNRAASRSTLSAHYDSLLRQIQIPNVKTSTGHAIGLISCAPRAGVSTVAFNVALSAARAECGSVLFIDADISKRSLHNSLDTENPFGLADVLTESAEPMDCVVQSSVEGLSIVAGRGQALTNLSCIAPGQFGQLLNEYNRHFALVVIDLPAPTDLNGSISLAGQMDGVVLVLEAERADGRAALRTKQQLVDAGATLLGVVLNKRRQYIPEWLYKLL